MVMDNVVPMHRLSFRCTAARALGSSQLIFPSSAQRSLLVQVLDLQLLLSKAQLLQLRLPAMLATS
jgi:hypothetical protein